MFFPIGSTGGALDQIAAAKRVCASCEAMSACLDFALATNQESGVWGGTSEEERRKLRKQWLAARRRSQQAPARLSRPSRPPDARALPRAARRGQASRGTATRVPALVGRERVDATCDEQRPEVARPLGDAVAAVRVRRRRERHAARARTDRAAPSRGTARRTGLTQPAARDLRGQPARRGGLGDAVPPLLGGVRDPARDLDEVGVRQHVARPRRGELLDARACRRPSRRRRRGHPTRPGGPSS